MPTVGFNIETVKVKKLSLDLWDVGGQESFRPMWRHYYTGTNAVVFVVDAADRDRIEQVKVEMEHMAVNDQLINTTWLVLANKQDLPNALRSSEIEAALDLKR